MIIFTLNESVGHESDLWEHFNSKYNDNFIVVTNKSSYNVLIIIWFAFMYLIVLDIHSFSGTIKVLLPEDGQYIMHCCTLQYLFRV